jgi:hypothetical protein
VGSRLRQAQTYNREHDRGTLRSRIGGGVRQTVGIHGQGLSDPATGSSEPPGAPNERARDGEGRGHADDRVALSESIKMKVRLTRPAVWFAWGAPALVSPLLFAQTTDTAILQGHILDQTRSPISGALVTVTSSISTLRRTARTDTEGAFLSRAILSKPVIRLW